MAKWGCISNSAFLSFAFDICWLLDVAVSFTFMCLMGVMPLPWSIRLAWDEIPGFFILVNGWPFSLGRVWPGICEFL